MLKQATPGPVPFSQKATNTRGDRIYNLLSKCLSTQRLCWLSHWPSRSPKEDRVRPDMSTGLCPEGRSPDSLYKGPKHRCGGRANLFRAAALPAPAPSAGPRAAETPGETLLWPGTGSSVGRARTLPGATLHGRYRDRTVLLLLFVAGGPEISSSLVERLTPNFHKTCDRLPRVASSLAPEEMIHYVFICEHLTEIFFKTLGS